MIRLNGYPFLHKEEYSFGVSVGEVMQKDLMVMTSGQRLDEIDQILLEKNYQGFPVVKNKESMILVGYIGRSELKYVIDKAKRIHGISNDAQCFFNLEGANSNIDGNDISQSSSSFIDFGSFIDETPMSVHPRLPLETVVDLFRKMGPRVILIEYIGKLVGLITVKDVLKYIAKREEAEELETIIPDASQTSYSDDDGLELVSRNSRKQGLSLLEMGRLQTSEDS
ncbi:hypothetical protein G9A89_015359 [Geosiphon pyriformis]|nr:hypothetical protein G9A89_015359 [Geosiphon pyriformis]